MRRVLLAVAVIAFAAAANARVTLLAPRAGERLEGGRDATIAWSADALPQHADEWEAFLSVDGGATWAVRITPHLDGGLRSFRFRVPNIATANARLLLRVGDESDEHRIELPQTFTIVPRAASIDFDETHARTADSGDGAIEWVSGDRSGRNLARHARNQPVTSDTPRIRAVAPCDEPGEEVQSAECCVPTVQRDRVAQHSARSTQGSAPVTPILLLSTRLNI